MPTRSGSPASRTRFAQRSATEQSELARARAETELRATDERYQLALRGCQDGLWEWDLGSDKVFLSPRWKGMLGFETPEISDDKAGGWRVCTRTTGSPSKKR